MADEGTVNSQITDSVSQVVTLLAGKAPSQSMAMLDTVLLETLGMAMHNAVSRQQHSHMTSAAAVTAACARMLQVRGRPAPPAPPVPPPTVKPVPSPPTSGAANIVENRVSAEESVTALRADAVTGATNATAAKDSLAAIAAMASKPLPTPPPPEDPDKP